MRRVDRLLDWAAAEGSSVGLALFRIVVGLMAVRYLVDYARDWSTEGFYGNFFFLPYTSLVPQPTELVYLLVIGVGIISAAFLILGCWTRVAAITCFLMVAYHFSLNQIWHRHNRYFLVLSLLLVCLGPSGRALSLDALRFRLPPVGPLWSTFLIKAQMTLIYLASATSKAMDTGWRGGDVLSGRRLGPLWDQVMPDFITRVIPPEAGVRLMTIQALISEYFLAIFVWFPRTRRLAFWWGIIFHGFIEVQYSVLTFTYLTLGSYFVFSNLRCGEKAWVYSDRSAAQRVVARFIPLLDWLFQIRLGTHSGPGQHFVGRDGIVYRGLMAWIMLGANLPILYLFFYPLSWLRFIGWGRAQQPVSSPAPSAQYSPGWLVACLALYIAFYGVINLYPPLRVPPDLLRFCDLPWFFGLMCLMAGTYHRSMVSQQIPLHSEASQTQTRPVMAAATSPNPYPTGALPQRS